MKNLTKVEFEKQIERMLKGEITRKKLAKELETDLRTLNGKITELAQTNPELYKRYITKFPYQPKMREDIDYEALVVNVMKQRINIEKAVQEYKVSRRTIARRIKDLEKTNPDLIKVYRKYADCIKRGTEIPLEIIRIIDSLQSRPVILRDNVEKKEQSLRAELEQFEKLKSTGVSNEETARRLGYDGYPTVWKKYKELERIEAEKSIKVESEESAKEISFKDRIKVESSELIQTETKKEADVIEKTENELEGK